ncbi:MAG: hypothetical protein JWR55_2822 [Aeromicrobium sp.]|nr:hypothetical protein [Aeromicrobium sp.]
MSARGPRWAIFLPVVVTVLLAGAIGGLIVVQAQRQADQVAEADAVAEAFRSDVGSFEAAVAREIQGARTADPGALRRVLEAAIADPPVLGDAPRHGAEQSAPYVAARETEQTFLEPYLRVDRELEQADVALTFIGVARDALELRATDYVGSGLLEGSAAIRSRLIPAFAAARDELAAVRVPEGQEELAATVRDAVQYVIDQATALAASIESNRAYSFAYSKQYQAAATAVNDYAATVRGDLTEAINAVGGG